MDFILDDDDDVDGDNCNAVAHIKQDDFEAILVQIVELLFILLVLSPSDIGILHTIPFTSVYTLKLEFGWCATSDESICSQYIVITCFVLVHMFVYCLLVLSIHGFCFMKAIQ